MLTLALKMLVGNKSSFLGVIFGIFLATLLISQQSAIFLGLVSRSYRMVTDISAPNVWVMDPATESNDKLRNMSLKNLSLVRSVAGVEWAVPIGISILPIVSEEGVFEMGEVYGIDDSTLIGAPVIMLEGSIEDLRRPGGIIVDTQSANGVLAKKLPDGRTIPVKIGDTLEINRQRAVIVGICSITPGFFPQPVIFTTFSQYKAYTGLGENALGYIAVKTAPGAKVSEVVRGIDNIQNITALTREQLKNKIRDFFLKTGILINFGLSVALGIIIGFSIAGQIFHNFTVENLKYYALIKSLGGKRNTLLSMILLQAFFAGAIGFILGTSATMLWGMTIKNTTLAFLFPWQLLLFTGGIILVICLSSALLSIHRVLSADPKVLLGN
ncbi:MAG: ABC transporter permease [Parachlamydiales bacterium]|jgi:putative ABC transport system permease protein